MAEVFRADAFNGYVQARGKDPPQQGSFIQNACVCSSKVQPAMQCRVEVTAGGRLRLGQVISNRRKDRKKQKEGGIWRGFGSRWRL